MAAAAAAAGAAPAFVFNLVPGGGDEPIDYSTPAGRKLNARMTSPLKDDYDLTEKDLKLFLDQLSLRALEGGWSRILTVIPVEWLNSQTS